MNFIEAYWEWYIAQPVWTDYVTISIGLLGCYILTKYERDEAVKKRMDSLNKILVCAYLAALLVMWFR